MSTTEQTTLPELLETLRWRWKLTLVVALLFLAGATVYVESLPSEYEGKAVVAIGPRPDVPSAGADTVRIVVPKYVEYAAAPSTAVRVAARLGADPDRLQSALDASVKTDTGVVTIRVRLPSSEEAAAAANAFADQIVAFSQEDPLLIGQHVARAAPAGSPAAPPRRLLEAAALVAGLALGIGASFLLERGRPRLRSWRDMARMTGYPVVGRVPPSRALRTRPTQAFADVQMGAAFRTLRANLEPQLRDDTIDSILVTSPTMGDGKSSVAALLAESLSRVGTEVLLVDADVKRPRLARLAKSNGHLGLSEVLRDRISLDDAIHPGWTDGLSILTTDCDPDVGDLIPTRFVEVMTEARKRFDVVIVDSPPLLGGELGRTLATMAKGILLVVPAGASATTVNEAILAVEALKAPLLGLVGNRMKEARGASYYY